MDPIDSVTPNDIQRLFDAAVEQSYKYSSAGSFHSVYTTILRQLDRYGYSIVLPNHEVVGLTFITRPKLNLSTASLRQDPVLSTLDTLDPTSLPFALRCLLDTKFSRRPIDIAPIAAASPFFNIESPFLLPLTNCLKSISGFPDIVIETETSQGGYFAEDITMATGSDMLNRTYDLSLTFRDIQGGFIAALFTIWSRVIPLLSRGLSVAYPEDIAARRLCYTCSIYRFVLDPSRRFITKWAKATGCYPISNPLGAAFNIGERDSFVSELEQIPVPFKANRIEYMDPRIFTDFNRIVKRYAPKIDTDEYMTTPTKAEYNFTGLPYIDTQSGKNELLFRARPEEREEPVTNIMQQIRQKIRNAEAEQTTVPTVTDNPEEFL